MTSMFFITLLVVFGSTPPTETHPGFAQLTILGKFQDTKSCLKAIAKMDLSDEDKESLGCVRVAKGSEGPEA